MLKVENLVIGHKYVIDQGFWGICKLLYCGTVKEGKRIKYRFTYGKTVDEWVKSFNFVACKSNFKILEEVKE